MRKISPFFGYFRIINSEIVFNRGEQYGARGEIIMGGTVHQGGGMLAKIGRRSWEAT